MNNQYYTKTKQNYEIVALILDDTMKQHNIVVFKRQFVVGNKPYTDYGWGNYYNAETGCWAWGHYDFKTMREALKDAYKNFKEV